MHEYISNEKRKYKCFGLTILTDFIMDELYVSDDEPDIEINYGKTPHFLTGTTTGGPWLQTNQYESIIHIEDLVRFYIKEGKTMIVDPIDHTDFSTIKIYMLGLIMSMILLQRKVYALHGSAIEYDHRSFMISGDSGAGKSSLCFTFIRKGHKFLADDMVVLKEIDGKYMVQPSFPEQKVCTDLAHHLNIDVTKLEKIRNEEKYFIHSKDEFCNQVTPISALFFLKKYDGNEVQMVPVKGAAKLTALIENTYAAEFVSNYKATEDHFRFCSDLASKVDVYFIYRPINGFTTDDQMAMIQEAMNKNKKEK